jgi:hypothetical protein
MIFKENKKRKIVQNFLRDGYIIFKIEDLKTLNEVRELTKKTIHKIVKVKNSYKLYENISYRVLRTGWKILREKIENYI